MKRIVVIGVALGVLLGPSAAQGHTTIIEPVGSHFPYQQWIDAARVPTPSTPVTVIEALCPGSEEAWACTDGVSTVWFSAANPRGNWVTPMRFLHEVGHIFADALLSDQQRAWYVRLIGAKNWLASEEEFAEMYGFCGRGLKADWLAPRVLTQTCALIRRVGSY